MTTIRLETKINAPIKICYDLSRSIDLHKESVAFSGEKAVEGKTSGLIEAKEFVTWNAKHFGFHHRMKVLITETIRPFFFHDIMLEGPFTSMQHAHIFQQHNGITIMRDEFEYGLPLGWIGKAIDKLFVRDYMTMLLNTRNNFIKEAAEGEKWKGYLNYTL
jgi:ligand-binding SRPBCC domain-containing protein